MAVLNMNDAFDMFAITYNIMFSTGTIFQRMSVVTHTITSLHLYTEK